MRPVYRIFAFVIKLTTGPLLLSLKNALLFVQTRVGTRTDYLYDTTRFYSTQYKICPSKIICFDKK